MQIGHSACGLISTAETSGGTAPNGEVSVGPTEAESSWNKTIQMPLKSLFWLQRNNLLNYLIFSLFPFEISELALLNCLQHQTTV